MRILLVGYNDGVLSALDRVASCRVVLIEEPDLWSGKGLAAKAAQHPCLVDVHLAAYQQSDEFLDVLEVVGAIDAVAPGLEYAVTAAARAAEVLGLPGAGTHAATTLRDKLLLREAAARAGLVGPAFAEVSSAADVERFVRDGAGVLKPANRQASLGVILLEPGDDLQAAWEQCTSADEGRQVADRPMSWRYLVEERMRGPEVSTECLVRDGVVELVNVTAKDVAPGPRPVELGHVLPAETGHDWFHLTGLLVEATRFGTGILHAEWIITADGPGLVECAGRPPGDRIMDLLDLAYGANLTDRWVRTLARPELDDARSPQRALAPHQAAAIRFVTARPGTIISIEGVDDARAVPGVVRVDVVRCPGQTLGRLESSWDRVGSVVATGPTPAEAVATARAGVDTIRVEVRAEPPGSQATP